MRKIFILVLVFFSLATTARAHKIINGVKVLTSIEELVDPAHSAIMVVDMQNEMVSTEGQCSRPDRSVPPDPASHQVVPHLEEPVEKLRRLLDVARRMNLPIFYAEYIHEGKDGTMLVNGPEYWTHSKSEWVLSIVEGSWGSRTIRELAPHKKDVVIRKNCSDAFHESKLDQQLEKKSIQCLLMTGIAAGGCVFATAMGAMEHDYYPVIVTDCIDQSKISHDFMEGRWPKFTSDEIIKTWKNLSRRREASELSEKPATEAPVP